MKLFFTLTTFILISLNIKANHKPEIYKRISSHYHDKDIVIAYNATDSLMKEFDGLPKDKNLNFGGVNVQIFKSVNDSLAYIHFGNKCAWTHFEEDDNINTIVRELIVIAYNN